MMSPSDTVVRRKPISNTSSSSGGFPRDSQVPSQRSGDEDTGRVPTSKLTAEAEHASLSYFRVIFAGLIPPFLITLAFGGRPSLLVLCFGAVISYIFDLLGAMEATLMTCIVTLMTYWGSLLYAARYMMQRSFLGTVPLLLCFAVLILWTFMALSSHFKAVTHEFSSQLTFAAMWMVAGMPLLCSAIVSWFICVEIPTVELPLCFGAVYVCYVMLLYRPDKKQGKENGAEDTAKRWSFIIPESNVYQVLVTPLVVSPVLYVVVHRNVIMTLGPRLQGLLASFAFPAMLLLFVWDTYLDHWNRADQKRLRPRIEAFKLVAFLLLVISVKDHHFFDDMKFLASANILPDFLMTPVLVMTCVLMMTAVYQYRSIQQVASEDDVYGITSSNETSVLFNHPWLSLCVVGSAGGISLLLGIDAQYLPLFFVGLIALSEYYMATACGLMRGHEILGLSLVAIGVFPIVVVTNAFADVTLRFLNFNFSFVFFGSNVDLSIQMFCTLSVLLMVLSVALPTLLAGRIAGKNSAKLELGFVPGSSDSASILWSRGASIIFSVGFFIFTSFATTLELIVREQNWSNVTDNIERIYPSWLFLTTAILATAAAFHVYSIDLLDVSGLMAICVVQCCKMLHLLGVPSASTIALASMMLSLLYPFFAKASAISLVNLTTENLVLNTSSGSSSDIFFLLLYSISVLFTVVTSKELVIDLVLFKVLGHNPTYIQSLCGCAAVECGFVVCGLLVFWNKASSLRSIFSIAFVVCVLVATEAVGPVSINFDPQSPTLFVVSVNPLIADQHSGLFLLVSGILLGLAFVDILPLKRAIPRYIFIIIFTYCFSVSLHSFAFPVYLGDMAADVGAFELPKLLCVVISFCGAFICVHFSPSVDTPTSLVGFAFWFASFLPVACLIWSYLDSSIIRHGMGILTTAWVSHSLIALSVRVADVFESDNLVHKSRDMDRNDRLAVIKTVITITSSILALVWGIIMCVTTHEIDADFGVPLVALVLICIKSGIFLKDTPSYVLSILASCIWWSTSAIYHVFFKGVAEGKFNVDGYDTRQSVFLPDADVSIWTATPRWMAYLHILLLLVPQPVIYLSTIFKSKNQSEDTLFALAIVSLVSAVASQIWSVRLMGVCGLVLGIWRCNILGQAQKISDRLI